MRSLCPDEIVAAVVRWSNDHVMGGQRFERVFENRTRQMWAVAVEGNDASLMTFREVRKHRSEACSKTFTLLRNHARSLTCQASQFVHVGIRAHDGNFTSPNERGNGNRFSQRTGSGSVTAATAK